LEARPRAPSCIDYDQYDFYDDDGGEIEGWRGQKWRMDMRYGDDEEGQEAEVAFDCCCIDIPFMLDDRFRSQPRGSIQCLLIF
jgi:hypothetical protein